MAIADRKRRAFLERQQLILDHADDLLRWNGYLGLNLDELAGRIEYSKATIYNHFQSKEDLVLAVATMHLESRAEFFGRALTFDGCTRERMFVIGVADMILARLFPHWFPIMQLVRTQSLWEKASPQHHAEYHARSQKCLAVIFEIIRQARAAGDLPADAPSDQHILTGLVSMTKGAHLLADGLSPEDSGSRPLEILHDNYHTFLDGARWQPLSRDFDYTASARRIEQALFQDEIALLENH